MRWEGASREANCMSCERSRWAHVGCISLVGRYKDSLITKDQYDDAINAFRHYEGNFSSPFCQLLFFILVLQWCL